MVTIKPGTPIRMKDSIPESERTDKRDETAQVIQDMWPAEKTKIAEAADCSRTHVDNVLEKYFEPLQPSDVDRGDVTSRTDTIELPFDVSNNPVLLRTYLKGYLDALDDVQDPDADASAQDVTDFLTSSPAV